MQSHVTTKETSQKLHELGLDIETEFLWRPMKHPDIVENYEEQDWDLVYKGVNESPNIPAPLLSELLAVMPEGVNIVREPTRVVGKSRSRIYWHKRNKGHKNYDGGNVVENAGLLLIWLIEEGHVDVTDLNSK